MVLTGIEVQQIVFAVLAYVSGKVSRCNDVDDYDESMLSMPWAARAVYTTYTLDGEVRNGGFNQYFWNTGALSVEHAAEDFELMDDHARAQVVRKALAVFLDGQDLQLQTRKAGTLDAFSDSYKESRLGTADTEYYSVERRNPFWNVLSKLEEANRGPLQSLK